MYIVKLGEVPIQFFKENCQKLHYAKIICFALCHFRKFKFIEPVGFGQKIDHLVPDPIEFIFKLMETVRGLFILHPGNQIFQLPDRFRGRDLVDFHIHIIGQKLINIPGFRSPVLIGLSYIFCRKVALFGIFAEPI